MAIQTVPGAAPAPIEPAQHALPAPHLQLLAKDGASVGVYLIEGGSRAGRMRWEDEGSGAGLSLFVGTQCTESDLCRVEQRFDVALTAVRPMLDGSAEGVHHG